MKYWLCSIIEIRWEYVLVVRFQYFITTTYIFVVLIRLCNCISPALSDARIRVQLKFGIERTIRGTSSPVCIHRTRSDSYSYGSRHINWWDLRSKMGSNLWMHRALWSSSVQQVASQMKCSWYLQTTQSTLKRYKNCLKRVVSNK